MPRNVTLTFEDGGTHEYANVPDEVQPEEIEVRALQEFPGKKVTDISGRSLDSAGVMDVSGAEAARQAPPPASSASPFREKPKKTFGQTAQDVFGETGIGAITGAITPEIMRYGGAALKSTGLPVAAPIGSMMEASSPILQGTRGSQAILGGIGGFASALGGNIAERQEYSPAAVEAIRFGSAVVAPEFANLTGYAIKKGFQKLLGLNTSSALTAIAKDLNLDEAQLTPSQREFILRKINEIRGKNAAGKSQEQIFRELDDEARRITEEASQRAARVERAGTAAGLEERRRAIQLGGLGEETTQAGTQAVERAKDTITSIGDITKQLSDVGNVLRDIITSRFSQDALNRSDEYIKQKAIRDEVVAAKENKGIYIDSTPEYKELIQDLKNKLLIGKQPLTKKTTEVTEPGVESAYRKIYDAITNKRVMIEGSPNKVASYVAKLQEAGIPVIQGTNPKTGEPVFYRVYKTSFDAMDDVRRKLGDAAFGKEVEGYEALGQKIAEAYYAKISNLQSKFAGESHDVLQSNYEIASRLLDKYRAKRGAKTTALDKYDAEKYKTDSKSLPSDFFNSQQSVADLIQLTGDRNIVVREASDYLAGQLRGLKDSNAVRQWINSPKNSDWLKALPEVKQKAESYIANLQRAEAFAERTSAVGKKIGQRGKLASAEEGQIEKVTTKEAGDIAKEAEAKVSRLIGTKEAPLQIKNMLLSGDRATWDAIAPVLGRTDEGKALLADAISQVMADRATTGVRTAGMTFRDAVAPALKRTKLMPEAQINRLQLQLDEIARMALPQEQKLTFAQRVIRNAIMSYVAPAILYRAPSSAVDVLNRRGQVTSAAPNMGNL